MRLTVLKTSSKLSLEILVRDEGDACFVKVKILNQPEEFNSKNSGKNMYFESKQGFQIESCAVPELGQDVLYLNGTGSYENETDEIRFGSYSPSALTYISRLRLAVEEFNRTFFKDTSVKNFFTE